MLPASPSGLVVLQLPGSAHGVRWRPYTLEFVGTPVGGITLGEWKPIHVYSPADGSPGPAFLELQRARILHAEMTGYVEITWPEPDRDPCVTIRGLELEATPQEVVALWRGIDLLDPDTLRRSAGGRPKGTGYRATLSADEIRRRYTELAARHRREHLRPPRPNKRQLADDLGIDPDTLNARLADLKLPWPPVSPTSL